MLRGNLERAAGCDSALLLRSGREAGKADDVADREDVADLGLIILVGFQAPARVAREAGGGEIQVGSRAGASRARQRLVGDDLLSAGQYGAHAVEAVLAEDLDRRDFFAQPQRHAPLA